MCTDPLATLARRIPEGRSRRRAVVALGAAIAALGRRDIVAKKKKGKRKRGATGPAGPEGPAGPPRTITVVTRTGPGFAVNAGSTNTGIAPCGPGETVTGGGVAIDSFASPGCQVVQSFPKDPESWEVLMSCPVGTGNFIPHARCLTIT